MPVPTPKQESASPVSPRSPPHRNYININSATSASFSSPTRSPAPRLQRAKLPPLATSPPPRIVIERRPTHNLVSQLSTAPPSDTRSRNPYRHRPPPRIAWSTPDLTTASLLLHTLQQPGYRPSSRSGASSTSSRSSSSRHQPQHHQKPSRVQPVPHSTTFDPERYFAGLEPIADSEPECTRSDYEYDRDKTVRSKGKDRTASLLLLEEGDEEQDHATVKTTDKDRGRTFVSAQKLRKLLDTSPAPGSTTVHGNTSDMLVVQPPPPAEPTHLRRRAHPRAGTCPP
jgi:hypothetical protein